MKKFFAFALVASMMSLAACSEKKAETTTVDSLTVDSTATMATDSMATDTTMTPDTTAKK